MPKLPTILFFSIALFIKIEHAAGQFQQRKWLLQHQISAGSTPFNFTYSSAAMTSIFRNFTMQRYEYGIGIGRFRKQHQVYYGLQGRYDRRGGDYATTLGLEVDAWSLRLVTGYRYFFKLGKDFFITPSAHLSAGLGKDRIRNGDRDTNIPVSEYNLNVLAAGFVLQPLRVGYQLLPKTLLDLSLTEFAFSTEQKTGTHKRWEVNNVSLSQTAVDYWILRRFQIGLTHQLR